MYASLQPWADALCRFNLGVVGKVGTARGECLHVLRGVGFAVAPADYVRFALVLRVLRFEVLRAAGYAIFVAEE